MAISGRNTAARTSTAHAVGKALRSGLSPSDLADFVALVQRVDHARPRPGDLVELEWSLARHPGIWRVIADHGRAAIDAMIEQLKPSPAMRLAFTQGAEELRTGLTAASPLEAAIAEQITVCWVRLRIYEFWLAKATGQEDGTLSRFWDERVRSAQRRFLDACRGLARIHQLTPRTPALVQINVGGQQVNVARMGSEPDGPAPELPFAGAEGGEG